MPKIYMIKRHRDKYTYKNNKDAVDRLDGHDNCKSSSDDWHKSNIQKLPSDQLQDDFNPVPKLLKDLNSQLQIDGKHPDNISASDLSLSASDIIEVKNTQNRLPGNEYSGPCQSHQSKVRGSKTFINYCQSYDINNRTPNTSDRNPSDLVVGNATSLSISHTPSYFQYATYHKSYRHDIGIPVRNSKDINNLYRQLPIDSLTCDMGKPKDNVHHQNITTRNNYYPYPLLRQPFWGPSTPIMNYFQSSKPLSKDEVVMHLGVKRAEYDFLPDHGIPDDISPNSASSVNGRSPATPKETPVSLKSSPESSKQSPHGHKFNFDVESLSDIIPNYYLRSEDGRDKCYQGDIEYEKEDILAISPSYMPWKKAPDQFNCKWEQYGIPSHVTNLANKDMLKQNPSPNQCMSRTEKIHSRSEAELPPIINSVAETKGVEVVNGGYGITNPIMAPLVIPDVKAAVKKQQEVCICRICGRMFSKQKHLKRHMNIEHGIKKVLCVICNKGFDDKFDLKRHTRTHTGVRPFKCVQCKKSFTQRCSLESHCRKVHSFQLGFTYKERREKLHVCEECGHTNKDANEHYVHIQQSHPNSPLLAKFHDKRQFNFRNSSSASKSRADF